MAGGSALELEIHADDVRRLLRHPALRAGPAGRSRAAVCAVTWHDTEAGALALRELALAETASGWRLERLTMAEPHHLVGEVETKEALGLEGEHRALATFVGRDRRIALGEVTLVLRSGVLRAGAAERPCHRAILTGPPQAVATPG